MSCGCSWASGSHMTKLSENGARVHEASSLGMTRGGSLAKGADILGTLGANMFSGLALEALNNGGDGGLRVGNDNGVAAGS